MSRVLNTEVERNSKTKAKLELLHLNFNHYRTVSYGKRSILGINIRRDNHLMSVVS